MEGGGGGGGECEIEPNPRSVPTTPHPLSIQSHPTGNQPLVAKVSEDFGFKTALRLTLSLHAVLMDQQISDDESFCSWVRTSRQLL